MPEALVLGVDPDAAALRERSAAAARHPDRGGLLNAVFLVSSAEALPRELHAIADELRVTLPWGALLRGALGPEPWFSDLVGRLLCTDGRARLVLSVAPSDHVPGLERLDRAHVEGLAERYTRDGLRVDEVAPVTDADVMGLGSSWAKRLGIPGRRSAWRLTLCRDLRDP